MQQLIWTRANDDWENDRKLIDAVALPHIALPCITAQEIPFTLEAHGIDYFVLTSPRAASIASRDPRLKLAMTRALNIFTFGDKTTSHLLAQGLHPLRLSATSAEELSGIISKLYPFYRDKKGLVLGPTRPAFNIATALEKQGFISAYLAIYQISPGLELTSSERDHYKSTLAGYACFASPSAVSGFTTAFMPKTNRLFTEVVAVAIGNTSRASLAGHFARIIVASQNSLRSLIDAVNKDISDRSSC